MSSSFARVLLVYGGCAFIAFILAVFILVLIPQPMALPLCALTASVMNLVGTCFWGAWMLSDFKD